MMREAFYHDGHWQLQGSFGSRPLADRLEEVNLHPVFSEADCDVIEYATFFLLATADSKGRPDCSFKGGIQGFVRVTDANELAFPDYDGTAKFKGAQMLVQIKARAIFAKCRRYIPMLDRASHCVMSCRHAHLFLAAEVDSVRR